jgi:hypothetical protein
VQLLVPATTCNATENAQLAFATWQLLTQGMPAADAALIVVEVASCTTTARRRLAATAGRHLLQTVTVKLVITVADTAQTPAQIQAATVVLIDAINIGGPAISLPPNATLSELVAALNNLVSNSPGNTVQELLEAVNTAIVVAGLDDVFNNATTTPTGACETHCHCYVIALHFQLHMIQFMLREVSYMWVQSPSWIFACANCRLFSTCSPPNPLLCCIQGVIDLT